MKQIETIYAEHADAPRISCHIDLNAWEVDKFDDLDKLVKHVTEELGLTGLPQREDKT